MTNRHSRFKTSIMALTVVGALAICADIGTTPAKAADQQCPPTVQATSAADAQANDLFHQAILTTDAAAQGVGSLVIQTGNSCIPIGDRGLKTINAAFATGMTNSMFDGSTTLATALYDPGYSTTARVLQAINHYSTKGAIALTMTGTPAGGDANAACTRPGSLAIFPKVTARNLTTNGGAAISANLARGATGIARLNGTNDQNTGADFGARPDTQVSV